MTLAGAEPGEVELREVTRRFGDVVAVDGVSLHVPAGSFVSLLGPSGCGKTTSLRLVAGFESPDAGAVLMSGEDVTCLPPHRRRVNTVFQHYALFPHLDVAGNVAYGLRRSGVPRAEVASRVSEVLERVRLGHVARRRPDQLSGGQRQRVALARAIVNRPPVLLLDEPLSALDRALREDMQIELKVLQRELGTTFVLVTHDQDEAMALSDHLVVMDAGRVVQQGPPSQVYDHPETLFAATFVGRQNLLAGAARGTDEVERGPASVRAGHLPGEVAAGEPATAVVRPFAVQVSEEEPEPHRNRVRGIVTTVADIGDIRQVLVTTGADELLSWSTRSADSVPPAPGTAVWCSWERADTHRYPGHPHGDPADPTPSPTARTPSAPELEDHRART